MQKKHLTVPKDNTFNSQKLFNISIIIKLITYHSINDLKNELLRKLPLKVQLQNIGPQRQICKNYIGSEFKIILPSPMSSTFGYKLTIWKAANNLQYYLYELSRLRVRFELGNAISLYHMRNFLHVSSMLSRILFYRKF